MAGEQDRIKDFFTEKKEHLSEKIEKTPMEKFFVFFLILISISAVVLGYFQFKKNIESPLHSSYLQQKRGELRQTYNVNSSVVSLPTEDIIRLQNMDSDLDGLSDYSEIYLYKTNPYLQDTDGDGLSDKEEILAGTDPNCPEGQVCRTAVEDIYGPTVSVIEDYSYLDQMIVDSSLTDLGVKDFEELQVKLLSGELSLAQLGIDDPELQKMLDQWRSGQVADLDQLNPQEKDFALQDMKNMSAVEIRQELLSRGVDKNLLDQIDDNTLKNVFLETLGQF